MLGGLAIPRELVPGLVLVVSTFDERLWVGLEMSRARLGSVGD